MALLAVDPPFGLTLLRCSDKEPRTSSLISIVFLILLDIVTPFLSSISAVDGESASFITTIAFLFGEPGKLCLTFCNARFSADLEENGSPLTSVDFDFSFNLILQILVLSFAFSLSASFSFFCSLSFSFFILFFSLFFFLYSLAVAAVDLLVSVVMDNFCSCSAFFFSL